MNWMAPYVTIPVVILKPYGKPVVILKLYGKRCYMFGDQNTFNYRWHGYGNFMWTFQGSIGVSPEAHVCIYSVCLHCHCGLYCATQHARPTISRTTRTMMKRGHRMLLVTEKLHSPGC